MNLFLELLLFLATLLYSYLEAFVKLFVPVRRKSLSGELVLITGAGHGVGRATALEFAKRQSRLVLWDINKVMAHSSPHSVTTESTGDLRAMTSKTTRAFLPVMMNNNYGHIVTVASAAGHFVIPFMVAYCSSKFAAVGFHKALTEELSALGKDGIKTTCLCPVFINTGFVKNPTVRLGKILEIEEVVEALMEGIVTNQKMVFVPPQLNIALLSEMVFPERALNVLKKLAIPKFDAVIGQRSTQ
ncbi:PREDICTED: 17-beta-hydroxysteroid dehydrogenase 13 [Corvus brachyrhynchos]|uniref:17-beta-hydroxysteroid dehydrogenase 13 n=1 Tax=Corvus brachyrhynchos TaxID=85066 RepID=UPI0008164AC2|nr:PREDICTED: 17-beta-hydroxysteroid dehydrogenase 13 [Corvus brachyrhynchos]